MCIRDSFYVAASPGIPLIPPVPVGQLNGGGAGFSNLADTVNGDYFAIPPLKLRGTLKLSLIHIWGRSQTKSRPA